MKNIINYQKISRILQKTLFSVNLGFLGKNMKFKGFVKKVFFFDEP